MNRALKRVLKSLASVVPGAGLRSWLLRRAGYDVAADVFVGTGLLIVDELDEAGTVIIGERASLAPRVTLVTSSYPNSSRFRDQMPTASGPVRIGADAWLGTACVVLPGVSIGEAAVVGAGAVVVKDVPPRTVVAGVPARPLRAIDGVQVVTADE